MAKYNDILTDILNKLPSGYPGGIGITAEKHREVETSILNFAKNQWRIGDIKEVDCTDAYINLNFERSGPNIGKGKVGGEREGWAICDGNDGRLNLTGRVCIAYETSMLFNGSPIYGGSKDAVVVSHKHTFESYTSTNTVEDDDDDVTTANDESRTTTGASSGVSGTGKNMQPYIVTLFIQKIS